MRDDEGVGLLLLAYLVLAPKRYEKGRRGVEPADEEVRAAMRAEATRGELLEPHHAEATVTNTEHPWFWPVPAMQLPGGSRYEPVVSSPYGVKRMHPKPHTHEGVDVMFPRVKGKPVRKSGDHGSKNYWAPPGTPVTAARAGKVYSVTKESRGVVVIVGHGEPADTGGRKLATIYRHLTDPAVKAGDDVVAGDVLGLMGWDPTDSAQTRHLHFEVWVAGHSVDPATLDMTQWGTKLWQPTATTTS